MTNCEYLLAVKCGCIDLPVTALVVVGKLSRSPFTAVTPIPYSVPGLRPTGNTKTMRHKNKKLCHVCVSLNHDGGGPVVKWPAVWANGSCACGSHENALKWLDCTIDGHLIAFHAKSVLTVLFFH